MLVKCKDFKIKPMWQTKKKKRRKSQFVSNLENIKMNNDH